MNIKLAVFTCLTWTILGMAPVTAAPVGQFSATTTIGTEIPGKDSAGEIFSYEESSQQYTVKNSPPPLPAGAAPFYYAYNYVEGDFILRAKITRSTNTTSQGKVGFTLCDDLTTSAATIHALVNGNGLAALEFRDKPNSAAQQFQLQVQAPDILQLERRGDTFIFSAAKHGEPFQVTSVSQVKLGSKIYAGLSYFPSQATTPDAVVFSNVRIVLPAAKDFRPYKDYIGSNLEILDMRTGNSRIVFRSPDSIQAPNWTRDGKFLIYNSKGLLYQFDIASGANRVINTGFATANNNDHVLSWKGNHIGISHHAVDDDNRSTLYILPITGSNKPKQINAKGAGRSYLHGFSPDDKKLVFTGERNNAYNIFTIDVKSKKETHLTHTNATTLNDGAEYTPDGKMIYFNSNRTGLMQLWRMRADGSQQEQVTFDNYNNWFPHISPDGKKIVFLSFMTDIDPGDHPFYRQVYLREMAINDNKANIIAYVYGGQGTINVPSWSPDGAFIAFVSNTR